MRLPVYPVLFILTLSGCAKSLNVPVQYPALEHLGAARKLSLENPLIVLKIEHARKDLPNSSRIEANALGRALMNEFSKKGKKAAGFILTENTAEAAPFAQALGASGIIEITLNPVSLEESKKEISVNDKTEIQWKAAAALSGSVAQNKFSASLDGQIPSEGEKESWFKKSKPKLWQNAAENIVAAVEKPVQTLSGQKRNRELLNSKQSPRLAQAYEAGLAGDWERAKNLWREAAEKENHSYAFHNLAACEEKEGRFREALALYRSAKSAHERNPIKGLSGMILPKTWDSIIEELNSVTADPPKLERPPSPVKPWFSRRLAVLPLNNNSNFVDAPEMIRRFIQERLGKNGYPLVDLSATDHALRAIGISDGGQLPSVPHQKIAQALKADLLLYGDITVFNEVPLGIYHKREVGLALKLLDVESGGEIWKHEQKINYQSGGGDKEAGARLIAQLAKGIYERFKKMPLKEETTELVDWMLAFLPSASQK